MVCTRLLSRGKSSSFSGSASGMMIHMKLFPVRASLGYTVTGVKRSVDPSTYAHNRLYTSGKCRRKLTPLWRRCRWMLVKLISLARCGVIWPWQPGREVKISVSGFSESLVMLQGDVRFWGPPLAWGGAADITDRQRRSLAHLDTSCLSHLTAPVVGTSLTTHTAT